MQNAWLVCFLQSCKLQGSQYIALHLIMINIFLQLVGICFEVHDTWKKRGQLKKSESEEDKKNLVIQLKYEEVDPSPMDVFHYAFNYVGVLTGNVYGLSLVLFTVFFLITWKLAEKQEDVLNAL